ncbi:hypothetical protein SAMN06265360_10453 [Haloechinothrix alba]|uniref:Protein RecA n=1 Tax=Haloechinothrix alba TaxID=664784 RepID=A0A238VTZ5_9PSEU|nr:hypothetical protein SAMN06265360_10453 [Haloechinothrix alba]
MSGSVRSTGAVARLSSLPGVSTASDMAAAAERDSVTGRLLPVRSELSAALPLGGLRRGSTVSVRGSRALLFALLAEATTRGSWAAIVGMPDIGAVAAAELGVDVRRLAVVPAPGTELLPVTAALLDGLDLVVLGDGLLARHALSRQQTEKLTARARHRGAVLLAADAFPGAELELHCTPGRWYGLDESGGYGYLRERAVTVHGSGRGAAAKPARVSVLLPGPSGGVAAPHSSGTETSRAREAG